MEMSSGQTSVKISILNFSPNDSAFAMPLIHEDDKVKSSRADRASKSGPILFYDQAV